MKQSPDERARILALQIEEILRHVDALPELDKRSPEEILDHDQHGLPR